MKPPKFFGASIIGHYFSETCLDDIFIKIRGKIMGGNISIPEESRYENREGGEELACLRLMP